MTAAESDDSAAERGKAAKPTARRAKATAATDKAAPARRRRSVTQRRRARLRTAGVTLAGAASQTWPLRLSPARRAQTEGADAAAGQAKPKRKKAAKSGSARHNFVNINAKVPARSGARSALHSQPHVWPQPC